MSTVAMALQITEDAIRNWRPLSYPTPAEYVQHTRESAVLCSDFARRSDTCHASTSVRFWPAERGVLVCDFAETQSRSTSSFKKGNASDHAARIVAMDGVSFESKTTAERDSEVASKRRHEENVHDPLLAITNSNYHGPGVYFRSRPDYSGGERHSMRNIDRVDGLHNALPRRIMASLQPESDFENLPTVPYEDELHIPRDDPLDKPHPVSTALSRLEMIRSQLDSKPAPLEIPDIQCQRSPCLFRLSKELAIPKTDAKTRGCVHDGCEWISRTSEGWLEHIVSEHHVDRSREKEAQWMDWGDGGRCCA